VVLDLTFAWYDCQTELKWFGDNTNRKQKMNKSFNIQTQYKRLDL